MRSSFLKFQKVPFFKFACCFSEVCQAKHDTLKFRKMQFFNFFQHSNTNYYYVEL